MFSMDGRPVIDVVHGAARAHGVWPQIGWTAMASNTKRRLARSAGAALVAHPEGSMVHMTSTDTAEVLFASTLEPSDHPSAQHVMAALRDSLRRHGGQQGCASICAAEYGDHPDTAPARMRWALALTEHGSPSVAIAT
jgi:hypothetical protein